MKNKVKIILANVIILFFMMVSCNEMNSTAPPKNKLPTQTWRCYTEYNTIEIREVDARYREGDTIFANPNSRHSYKVVLKENVTK